MRWSSQNRMSLLLCRYSTCVIFRCGAFLLKDYEEDFEEADESDEAGGSDERGYRGGDGEQMSAQQRKEVEAIQRAMEAENQRLGSVQSEPQMRECEEAGRDATPGGVAVKDPTTSLRLGV